MRTRTFRRFFVYGALMLLISVSAGVVVGLRVFSVTLAHNTCATKEQLLDKGRVPLWLWERYAIENMRQFPCIKTITTVSKFPGSIHLTIKERMAVLRIMSLAVPSVQPEAFLMDEDGFVFSKTDKDDHLPSIFIVQPVVIGDEFKEIGALPWDQILENFKRDIGTPQKIVYQKPDLEITFDTLLLYVPASKAIVERLPVVAAIVNQANKDDKPVRLVDYRFERPVISY